ncbi:hypothetical protein [Enterovirga rhinocerotis]|uniref:Helix-turn-helix protein n=1 Tax=Enterovirga rhinocerotis TaxID=1339210 RepID=A0A4R7CAH3_9HYPH|nr:hypothetical protein [Enterovirga rhinocerotis]TDR93797.1 hypothetical protein EV668_1064 [Enterovirga rhinocerotis]
MSIAVEPSSDELRSFTSWKLDVLNAASADTRLKSGPFRVLYRVVKYMNAVTREAIVSDETLSDDLGVTRSALHDARKQLAELGWWRYRPGRYGRGTIYTILDDNVNGIENRLLDEREIRRDRRNVVRRPHSDGARNVASAPHCEPINVVDKLHCEQDDSVVERRHCDIPQCGPETTSSVVAAPPIHLDTPARRKDGSAIGRSAYTRAHARPSPSGPIVIPAGDDMALLMRLGGGSWVRGSDRLEKTGDASFRRERVKAYGLTAGEVAAIEGRGAA